MKKILTNSILFLVVLSTISYSQGIWSWYNPIPQGNALNGVHFTNDNTGWAVGEQGTIIKTTNGGSSWIIQNSGTYAGLNAVQFLNANLGFAVGDSGVILKTTNGGTNWNKLNSGYNYWMSSLHFVNENYGWVGAGNYILATTNGGANWQSYYQGAPFSIHGVFFLSETTGFWVGFGGVNKTINGGSSFTRLSNVPSNYDYDDIYFINSTTGWIVGEGGVVAKTTDGGSTWTQVGNVTGYYDRIFFKDEDNGWIAGGYNGIYTTQDGGNSWLLTSIRYMYDVFFTPNVVFSVGTGGKIFKSTDLGISWYPSYQNIMQDKNFTDVFFNDPAVGFAVGDTGKIFKTENGGLTWTEQTSPTTANLASVFFTDVNTGWITGYQIVLKTTNSGSSWSLKYTSNYDDINDAFFVNSQLGWVVGDKILKTTDGGNNWTNQTIQGVSGDYYLTSVYFIDENKGFCTSQYNYRFYKTTNGGSTWTSVILPTSVELYSVKFVDNNTGWIAGGQGTILKTTDGGTNWEIQNFGQNYTLLNIFAIDSQTLWAVGGTTNSDYGSFTLLSINGGNTWTKVENPNTQCLYSAYFVNKNSGWAVGEQGAMLNYSNNVAIPQAPSNLIASTLGDRINLSWTDNASNEDGFEVFRSDNYSGNYKKIATLNPNTVNYIDNSVTAPATFWYRIRTFNNNGTSALCREDSSQTYMNPPAAPQLLSPTNGAAMQPTSLTLTWIASPTAQTYHIQLAADAGFTTLILNDSTLVSVSKSVSILNNSQTYHWKVRAKNAGGWSTWSDVWTFSTVMALPAAPTLLSPPNYNYDQPNILTLQWNAVNGADNYQCLVATDWQFNNVIFNNEQIITPSVQVGPLENNKQYYWQVRAANQAGWGQWSNYWTFTTRTLAAPTLVSPPNFSSNQPLIVTLSWNSSVGAEYYQCLVAIDYEFNNIVFSDTGVMTTSVQVGPLANSMNYYWKVRSANSGGYSNWTFWWNFSTITAAPNAPLLSSPANGSSNISIYTVFEWVYSVGIDSYKLLAAKDNGFTDVVLDTTLTYSSCYYILENSSTYYWKVQAQNAGGISNWSEVWSFTTEAGLPSIPYLMFPLNSATNVPVNTELRWTKCMNAERYHLQISKNTSFTDIVFESDQLTDTLYSASLDNNVKYYWHVRALNQSFSSGWSSMWNFTTIMGQPSVPNLIQPSNNSANISVTTTLYWSRCINTQRYHLQISTDVSFSNIVTESDLLTDTLYTVIFQHNTQYFWHVRALNDLFSSTWSQTWNFITESASSVERIDSNIPLVFDLKQNYPNPFNPQTAIEFDLPEEAQVQLILFDNLGKQVEILCDAILSAGRFRFILDANTLTSGVYYYRLTAGEFISTKKMLLVR